MWKTLTMCANFHSGILHSHSLYTERTDPVEDFRSLNTFVSTLKILSGKWSSNILGITLNSVKSSGVAHRISYSNWFGVFLERKIRWFKEQKILFELTFQVPFSFSSLYEGFCLLCRASFWRISVISDRVLIKMPPDTKKSR